MTSRGLVKQVLSGDTIVVMGQARGGPPPERTLSIAGISAPRLARRPGPKDKDSAADSKDEPFAWQSREFLRRRIVGKEVEFTVDYKVPSGREYATITFGPAKENLAHLLVQEGLAKPREGGKGPVTAEQQEISAKAAVAQAAQKGVYGPPEALAKAVRNVQWNVENLRALVDSTKGKPVDAVVENVRDGCTLRVTLLPDFQNVTVVMSGIKTPTFKRVGEKEEPEPFAEQARFFTEVRLLQRDVKIVLEGVTGANVLGTVQHAAGSIAELLLQNGYARIVDWSFGNVTSGRDRMRAAEQTAKTNRLRLWADHKVTERAAIDDREFVAVVEEIVSTDCIVVSHKGRSRKIFLASIRQPRPKEEAAAGGAAGSAAPKKRANYWEIPWAFEAREFLRKKLIGQKAQVHIDFVKAGTDGMPERTCATVKVEGTNIAEALVSKGYATVVRYREGDDDRASAYDDLLAAEARAQKSAKGVHAEGDVPIHRINDVSTRPIAEKLLPSLQRAGRLQGVVEYVQSGSRLRVYLPKESCIVTVLLAGLSCPRAAGGADKPAEPYGDEALAFMRSLVLQREVDVELEDIDKTGCFVGSVYLGGQNVAVGLLADGLSKLHPSVERYKNTGVLLVAETAAKDARRKLWTGYVEPVAVVETEQEAPRTRKFEPQEVTVTEVTNSTTFWAQSTAAKVPLDNIMSAIATAFSIKPPQAHPPKRNELVVAKFSADGQWYRAKVLKVISPTQIQVLYVDFGNSETVTNRDIAALPPGASGPALANEYHIAFLQPAPADWQQDSADFLREKILNRTVRVNVEYRDAGAEYVTVFGEDKEDIGLALVSSGLSTFKGRSAPHLQELLSSYSAAQSAAKSSRKAMWRYGDITEDETPDFGRGR